MDADFAAAAGRLAGQAALLCGWRPAEFWAATPAELAGVAVAIRGEAAAGPLGGGELAALMTRYPDA